MLGLAGVKCAKNQPQVSEVHPREVQLRHDVSAPTAAAAENMNLCEIDHALSTTGSGSALARQCRGQRG